MFTKVWCGGPFRKAEEVNPKIRNYILSTTFENLTEHDADTWGNFSKITGAEKAKDIKQPVLIIYGNKDVPFIKRVSDFYDSAIRTSKVIEIKDAAHMLNMEKPEEFNKVLADFLDN